MRHIYVIDALNLKLKQSSANKQICYNSTTLTSRSGRQFRDGTIQLGVNKTETLFFLKRESSLFDMVLTVFFLRFKLIYPFARLMIMCKWNVSFFNENAINEAKLASWLKMEPGYHSEPTACGCFFSFALYFFPAPKMKITLDYNWTKHIFVQEKIDNNNNKFFGYF